jgi:hypothetical protein
MDKNTKEMLESLAKLLTEMSEYALTHTNGNACGFDSDYIRAEADSIRDLLKSDKLEEMPDIEEPVCDHDFVDMFDQGGPSELCCVHCGELKA